MKEDCVCMIVKRRFRDEEGALIKIQSVSEPLPEFPSEILRPGLKGAAEVAFTVFDGGEVNETRIISATHSEFGAAVQAAIGRWRFASPVESGLLAPVKVRCHLSFET